MLWMYQRVIWGEITNAKNELLGDMNRREKLMIVPLLILIVWMGMYSESFSAADGRSREQAAPPDGQTKSRICAESKMTIPEIHIPAILPSVVLAIFGIVIMVADPFLSPARRWLTGWAALAGVVLAGLSVLILREHFGLSYSNLWIVDDFTVFFHVVFLFIIGMTILSSMDFITREKPAAGRVLRAASVCRRGNADDVADPMI